MFRSSSLLLLGPLKVGIFRLQGELDQLLIPLGTVDSGKQFHGTTAVLQGDMGLSAVDNGIDKILKLRLMVEQFGIDAVEYLSY